MPHILFFEFDEKFDHVKFSTTKFNGPNTESSEILEIITAPTENVRNSLKNVNLFPEKTHDLNGREITLAIFNYMPYTLWNEAVSKIEVFSNFSSFFLIYKIINQSHLNAIIRAFISE